jgi:hypothetical protein
MYVAGMGGNCVQDFDGKLERGQLEDPSVHGRVLRNRMGGRSLDLSVSG